MPESSSDSGPSPCSPPSGPAPSTAAASFLLRRPIGCEDTELSNERCS
ncbi:hypothetical protein EYF80_066787 [Liparis tanakae]|uniref:Uncharacterized protein n=1 Tax=Liparis tanakae TaxID=230148 RepID=A0A4Z2E2G7_9TELE|nr:hypothetical protein EYF80_066787 [Liparis tanakae]